MIDTVAFSGDYTKLRIIDQTQLPNALVVRELMAIEEIERAIKTLQVRGAPAIGVAAAIGLSVLARRIQTDEMPAFLRELRVLAARLVAVRPTAVNLAWAVRQMTQTAETAQNTRDALARLREKAEQIRQDDIAACKRIGEAGSRLLFDDCGVLTHCNAGRLAAVRYGTALAPIYAAAEQGKRIRVFADETRPLLQGARLTAYELHEAGIDVTLACDNMAASLMAQGKIDLVLIGADRIAANGDAANKTGSLGLSILAKHFDVPFYVCAPLSTFDADVANGAQIPIEQRDPAEITAAFFKEPIAPAGILVYNPAFDVVPHTHITAFVTERGICDAANLKNLV
ncbi:MAG: S-methyl-5-thioribose-1-phosphate isomerase [Oscillospiraceae bacterium]|nr:S-methyl-5-thioribose-1-phosphate isomerase [Oscillospiraceae bacterium]